MRTFCNVMDGGMIVGSTAVPPYHPNGAPRDSTDRGRCANLCFRCRRQCNSGDYGSDEPHRCTSVLCQSVCSRLMLFTVNLFCLLAGWMLVGLGIWIHIFHETVPYYILFRENSTAPFIVLDRVLIALIVTGSAITIIGFLGCYGACTESVCCLSFYAVLLVLSFVAQVAIAALVITFHDQVQLNTINSLQFQIQNEYNVTGKPSNDTESDSYKITKAWDLLQKQLNCCGSVGPEDYYFSMWYNNTDYSNAHFVPQSCCPAIRPLHVSGNCQIAALAIWHESKAKSPLKHHLSHEYRDVNDIHANANRARSSNDLAISGESTHEVLGEQSSGCHSAMIKWISSYLPFIFVILAVDILQLMNVVCACLMIGMVRRKQVDYSWCEDQDEVG